MCRFFSSLLRGKSIYLRKSGLEAANEFIDEWQCSSEGESVRVHEQVGIPSLVRVKPGALDRLGVYCARFGFNQVALMYSAGLMSALSARAQESLLRQGRELRVSTEVSSGEFEEAITTFRTLPADVDAVVGLGGGRALDVAKYVAMLAGVPFIAVPTSLSNDGFCSPQSSLVVASRRRSLKAHTPAGVVVDTDVCRTAPDGLWASGVGDLAAKLTATRDWKLAFHRCGTPVDDFAVLISDSSVYQFLAHPKRDLEGVRQLATALMLNGIAMSIAGSSRPASGSEHLISHALDQISTRPRLHGLQVGVASFLVTVLQAADPAPIERLFGETGFWRLVHDDPFDADEWRQALELAPSLKQDFYTVLNEPGVAPLTEFAQLRKTHETFARCFGHA